MFFVWYAKGGNSWKGSPLSVVLIAKRSLLCFSGLVAKKVPHDGVSIISCFLRVAFGGRRSFRSRGRIEGTSIVSSVWSVTKSLKSTGAESTFPLYFFKSNETFTFTYYGTYSTIQFS